MAGKYQIYTQVNFRLTGMEESLQKAKSSLEMVTKQIEAQKTRIKELTDQAKAAGKDGLSNTVKAVETGKLKDLRETQKRLNAILKDGALAVNAFRDGISSLEQSSPKAAAQMDRLLRKSIQSVNSTSAGAAEKIKMIAEALKISEARVKQFGAGFMNMVKPFNRTVGESIEQSRDYIRIFERYGHTIAKTDKEYKIMAEHAAYSRQNIAQLEGTIKVGYDTNKGYANSLKAVIAEQQRLQMTSADKKKGISEADAADTRIMARRKEFQAQKELGDYYNTMLANGKSYSTKQLKEAVTGAEQYQKYMTDLYEKLKLKYKEYTDYVKTNGNLVTKQAAEEAQRTVSKLMAKQEVSKLSEDEDKKLKKNQELVDKFKKDTKAGYWAESYQELIKFQQEEQANGNARIKQLEKQSQMIAENKKLLMDSVDAENKLTEAGAKAMLGDWKQNKSGKGRYSNIQNLDDAALKEVKSLYSGINQELSKKATLTAEETTKLEESKRVLKAIKEQEDYRSKAAQFTVSQMQEQLKVELELQKSGNNALRKESRQRVREIANETSKALGNMSLFSGDEQQRAMQLAKELMATGQLTEKQQDRLNAAYFKGSEYLKQQALNSDKLNSSMTLGVKMQDIGNVGAQYKNLQSISDAALQSQITLWSKVKDEARGSEAEVKKAEEVLRVLNEESKNRIAVQGQAAMRQMTGVGGMATGDIKTAIEQMKKYGESTRMTANERDNLTKAIQRGETKLAEYERMAKRVTMEEQLTQVWSSGWARSVVKMTDQALQEQKRFWSEEANMTQKGSVEYTKAADKLGVINAELQRRVEIQKQLKASDISSQANGVMGQVDAGAYDKSISGLQQSIKLLQEYRGQLKVDDTSGLKRVDETIMKLNADLEMSKSGFLEAKQYIRDVDGGKPFTGSIADLERIKKSLEEYKRSLKVGDTSGLKTVNDALNKIDVEQQKLKGETVSWKNVLSNLKTASYDELKKAAEQLNSELKAMNQNQKGFVEKSKSLRDIDRQMKTVNKTFKYHESTLKNAASRLKSYVMIYMGFQAIMMRIRNIVSSTQELSDQMTNVGKVTGMTNEQISHMTDSLQALDTRVTNSELMSMAEQAGKLGLAVKGGTDAIVQFVTVGQQISSTLGEEIGGAEAIAELLKINDLVNKGTSDTLEKQMERVGSSILDVGNKSKASYADIVNFTRRVGAVGSVAGLSMPQIVALGGTYSALGASMEQSATAVNRMMIGLNNSTDAIAKAARVSTKELRNMVQSGDTFGALKLVIDNIKDEGLVGVQRVLKAIGGRVNAQLTSALSLLVDNMHVLNQEMDYAQNGYNQATTLGYEFNRMNENLAGTMKRVGNNIKEAFVNSALVDGLTAMVHGLLKFFDYLNKTPAALATFTASVMLLTKALWANKIAWIQNMNAMVIWGKTGVVVKGFAKMTAAVKAFILALKQEYIMMRGAEMKPLTAGLATATMQVFKLGDAFAAGFKKAAVAVKNFMTSNWFTLLLTVVASVGYAIYKYVSYIDPLAKAKADISSKTTDEIAKANSLFGSLESLNEEYKKAGKHLSDVSAEKEKLIEKNKAHEASAASVQSAEERVSEAEEKLKGIENERKSVIDTLNGSYSNYLGYMVSETSQANLLAAARERVVLALKQEMNQKMINAHYDKINESTGEDFMEAREKLLTTIGKTNGTMGRETAFMTDFETKVNEIITNASNKGTTITPEQVIYILKRQFGTEGKYVNKYYSYDSNKEKTKNIISALEAGLSNNVKNYVELALKRQNMLVSQAKDTRDMKQVLDKEAMKVDREEVNALINQSNVYYRNRKRGNVDDENYKKTLSRAIEILKKYEGQNNSMGKTAKDNLSKLQSQLNQLTASIAKKAERSIWGVKGKTIETMSGEELKALRDKIQEAYNAAAEGGDYSEIFPDLADIMKGKDRMEAMAALLKEEEKITKQMESMHLTPGGTFKRDNTDPAVEEEKRMTDLMNQVKNEFEAEWKRKEQQLSQEYIDGKVTKDVFDMQMEQLKNARLKDLEELDKALLKESNTFNALQYKMISQTDVSTLAGYISGDGRGKKLRDNLHKEIETAEAEFMQANVELKAEIDKILSENNPYDGMIDALTTTLMKLKILMSDNEVVVAKSVGNMAKIESDRTAFLMNQMMKAYELDVEKMRDLAKRSGNVDIDGWMTGLTDEQVQVAINKVQEFYDQYIQTVQKEAQRFQKVFDMKWNTKGENGASNQDIWNSLESAMKRTMSQQSFIENVVGAYRQAGGVNESDRLEIAMTEQQIALLNEKLLLMEKEKQLQIEAANATYNAAMEQANQQEDLETRNEMYLNAEAKRQAELSRINAKFTETSKDLIQERVAANQTLYEKQIELQQKTIAKIQPYMDALNTFGQAFGEAVFGSKEDRQSAAKQLLIDVMTTTKNIIQQYLIDLAMKKLIESEKRKEQIQTLMTTGTTVGGELTLTGAKTTADVAAGIASGTSKEIGSKGFAGLALAGAISVALSALLGVAMSAINKSKAEVSAVSGNSVSKLKTGMLTYASGRYPVMGDDGREYDARYEKKLRTGVYGGGAHFGIFSEKKPEAVIDGNTTEKLMLDYPSIWKDILSLSKNGGLSPNSAYGNRRMAAYAKGNLNEISGTRDEVAGMKDESMKSTLEALTVTVGMLQQQLANGIGVNIPMFGDGGLNKTIAKMDRFKKKNGIK